MFTNWKTTALGAGAILTAAGQLATMFASGSVDGNVLVTDFGIIFAGVSGLFAKDFNVTGGSVKQ